MSDDPVSTGRLVSEALSALEGRETLDAAAVQRRLAETALALARALPVPRYCYDPDMHGPPMAPDEIEAVANEARYFLEVVAAWLASPSDPDGVRYNFAFSAALKRRAEWKPQAELTAAQRTRLAAASRVYELMAMAYFDKGQRLKQEAAIASVMREFGLARSKVMQGLKEYRDSRRYLGQSISDENGGWRLLSIQEQIARTHELLANFAMHKVWFERNPDAQFFGVPAGSEQEKEMLSRESPRS